MKNLVTILLVFISVLASAQTDSEKLMVKEINELRANPKSFIPLIEANISFNEKCLSRIESGKMKVSSTNGSGKEVILDRINSAKELIKLLENIGSLDTLSFNSDMYIITTVHSFYLKSSNRIGHTNAKGDNTSKRFESLGLNVSENVCSVGNVNSTVRPILITLLIDAGISNRGHRNNLLNKDIKFISVSLTEGICVQNFAK